MASENAHAIEDAITLAGLAVYKQQSDQLYAGKSVATTTADGLMSASDKGRLDGLVEMTDAEIDAAVEAAFAD